ncbi:MAG: amino acid permease [Blastocatellia bacterium]
MPQSSPSPPTLLRHLNTLQATALNMSNMIGVGPFITIPLLMSAMGGPQALLGWFLAILIVIPDGLVWSELGAALPGSGGSYLYLREGFGAKTFGRLAAFLFIWQFILSGPLEIASGYIGFVDYLGYIWRDMTMVTRSVVIVAIGGLNILLLYRRITHVGKLTVFLWAGMLLTVAIVIVTGAFHFSFARAFDFPPGAFGFSTGFFLGLGAATRIGIYDYLGYYDICYLGDEVQNPGKAIPRSVIVSILTVALIYIGINLSIIGVVSWREFVPADNHPEVAKFVVSIFMERIYGSKIAVAFTLMILWTGFASCFALLLGYSRIPFAAARDGYFFRAFSRLHPRGNFPHLSLLVIGVLAIGCSFFSLGTVIDALLVTRIVVQFMGQIAAVQLLRRNQPQLPRPFRIWLYPLPSLLALLGWIFVFLTTASHLIWYGVGVLGVGVAGFFVWARLQNSWPFRPASHSI